MKNMESEICGGDKMTSFQKNAIEKVLALKDFLKDDVKEKFGESINIIINSLIEQERKINKQETDILYKKIKIDNLNQQLFQQAVTIIEQENEINKQKKLTNFILYEQMSNGFLVNFNTLNEARKYYERKIENEHLG